MLSNLEKKWKYSIQKSQKSGTLSVPNILIEWQHPYSYMLVNYWPGNGVSVRMRKKNPYHRKVEITINGYLLGRKCDWGLGTYYTTELHLLMAEWDCSSARSMGRKMLKFLWKICYSWLSIMGVKSQKYKNANFLSIYKRITLVMLIIICVDRHPKFIKLNSFLQIVFC